MNYSQTVHAIQFRAQAAQLHVTSSRHTAISISQQHLEEGGFSLINYSRYNHFCAVSVVEVPETLENLMTLHLFITSSCHVALGCTAPWYSHTATVFRSQCLTGHGSQAQSQTARYPLPLNYQESLQIKLHSQLWSVPLLKGEGVNSDSQTMGHPLCSTGTWTQPSPWQQMDAVLAWLLHYLQVTVCNDSGSSQKMKASEQCHSFAVLSKRNY